MENRNIGLMPALQSPNGETDMAKIKTKRLGSRDKAIRAIADAEAKASRIDVNDRRYAGIMTRAKSAQRRAELHEKWRPWEGTPETNERIALVPPRRRQSPIARMIALGKLDAEDGASAIEIAMVIEMIEAGVQIRTGTINPDRVDCSSRNNALLETLNRIRLEVAYTAWRAALPAPKRMVIDMIVGEKTYVLLARENSISYRRARSTLVAALRAWPGFKYAARSVEAEDVHGVYSTLGEGMLLTPKPRHQPPAGAINDDAAR